MCNKHSEQCQKDIAEYQERVRQYLEKYPNSCERCRGWGGHVFYDDPSPAGVSLSPGFFMDFEWCEDCTAKGRCSKCGQVFGCDPETDPDGFESLFEETNVEGIVCKACGAKVFDEGVPEGPECYCWETWSD